ncbi:conserved exported hypothetical protein [Bradyrhizobium sp. ORS 375]|uniref:hypothetical protein n=1 Tax=Bradyrhizobium sp. (strain ORS 375) TaxID=566679 RepID=UPI0002406427|nr:hypothetical protein [Bradyrhizobium sp. ORS 375]CCD94832.1 conserved exported hypothetical protein [Bradyrhizobium sp. ORS 375]
MRSTLCSFGRSAGFAFLVALSSALLPQAARADRCDDVAKELKNGIEGIKIGQTAAGTVYLAHPKAREITLGCSSKNFSNQLFGKTDRKPPPAFVELMASAAAIVFTLPKDDMVRGVNRCYRRLGIFRGDDVPSRYRRLDMRCARTKTESSITITRSKDQ